LNFLLIFLPGLSRGSILQEGSVVEVTFRVNNKPPQHGPGTARQPTLASPVEARCHDTAKPAVARWPTQASATIHAA